MCLGLGDCLRESIETRFEWVAIHEASIDLVEYLLWEQLEGPLDILPTDCAGLNKTN